MRRKRRARSESFEDMQLTRDIVADIRFKEYDKPVQLRRREIGDQSS